LYGFFQQVVVDSAAIKDAGVEEKTAEKIVEAVKSRIKEASIKIEGKLKLTSFASNGIDIIKEALKKAEEIGKKSISIKYLGAGSYNIIINAKEYKDAEKLLKEASEKAIEHVMEYDGEGEFTRVET